MFGRTITIHPMIPALFLIAAVVFFRCTAAVLDDATLRAVANFSPLAAMALCSGALFPRKWALAVPVAAQVVSDAVIHLLKPHAFHAGYSLLLLACCLALAGMGWALRQRPTLAKLLLASLGGSLFFYAVTNTAAFWYDPGYEKSMGGWLQALTTGVPGYPPTWMFLLKSLAGDLTFTVLFTLACGVWSLVPEKSLVAVQTSTDSAASTLP